MAGLLHLAWRAALAAALAADPTPATAEATCDRFHETDGDIWWDCVVALETYRCDVQRWCDDQDNPPHDWLRGLPDPARPGQSYVTKRGTGY